MRALPRPLAKFKGSSKAIALKGREKEEKKEMGRKRRKEKGREKKLSPALVVRQLRSPGSCSLD